MSGAIALRSRVRYIGGSRFSGSQDFPNGAKLYVGDEGIVHAVPGEHAQLGCTFGALRVSLNLADIQPIGLPIPSSATAKKMSYPSSAGAQRPLPVTGVARSSTSSATGPSSPRGRSRDSEGVRGAGARGSSAVSVPRRSCKVNTMLEPGVFGLVKAIQRSASASPSLRPSSVGPRPPSKDARLRRSPRLGRTLSPSKDTSPFTRMLSRDVREAGGDRQTPRGSKHDLAMHAKALADWSRLQSMVDATSLTGSSTAVSDSATTADVTSQSVLTLRRQERSRSASPAVRPAVVPYHVSAAAQRSRKVEVSSVWAKGKQAGCCPSSKAVKGDALETS